MKKLFFLAAVLAVVVCAQAQHVTPVTVKITEVNLDSIRTANIAPTDYLVEVEKILVSLETNQKELKAVEKELKDEQNHLKNLQAGCKETQKSLATLEKLYTQEHKTLSGLMKSANDQYQKAMKMDKLDRKSRNAFLDMMEAQKEDMEYSLREVDSRLRSVSDNKEKLSKVAAATTAYEQEVKTKALDLAQLTATLKERMDRVKVEVKTTKAQIKASK